MKVRARWVAPSPVPQECFRPKSDYRRKRDRDRQAETSGRTKACVAARGQTSAPFVARP